MNPIIETERLIIREIALSDIDGLFELDCDPEVHRYLGNSPVTDKNQLVEVIDFIRQQYADNGVGRWAVIDKRTNHFLGWAGLKLVTESTNNHINYYDLGYRIQRKYWGQGIATEGAMAILDYAFSVLKTPKVYAIVDCKNNASNKILNKLGFTCMETFELDNTPHYWYKIEK